MMIRKLVPFSVLACVLLAGSLASAHDASLHKGKATEGEIVSIRRPIRIDGGRDGSDLPAPRHSVGIAAKCCWSLATTTLRSPR